jgi:Zn-dependent protease/predicted transcriptional regulator
MFPSGGIKIAKIFGIEILINPTWLIIFALVGYFLGFSIHDFLVINHANASGPWPWILGFVTAIVFLACLLAHELSHSYVAKRHGVKIRRITLFIFGGVAEMSEDVADAGTELRMAIAGPAMTFVLAGIFYLLYRLVGADPHRSLLVIAPFLLLWEINLFVGVFNLLPGFPLDGGRVFRAILWKITGDLRKATRAASYGGQVVGVLMAAGGIAFGFAGQFINAIWLILIGAFVFQLARASYQQTLFRLAVADTKVSDLMFTDVPVVNENTTLTTLRTNYFNVYHLPAFPVVDDSGKVTGLVSRDDLVTVNPSEWDILNAGRVAHPLTEDQVIEPDAKLDLVMRRVMRADQFLLVMEDGQVRGILTADELMRYIRARIKTTKG